MHLAKQDRRDVAPGVEGHRGRAAGGKLTLSSSAEAVAMYAAGMVTILNKAESPKLGGT